MYRREIPKLPIPISRDNFVELVFDLGRENSHGYDTIIAAVQIGDYFVSYSGDRVPFRPLSQAEKNLFEIQEKRFGWQLNETILDLGDEMKLMNDILANRDRITFMDELVSQIYSVELAHVVTVISVKCNEDFDSGYDSIKDAASDTENSYVKKMEWEIFTLLGFKFKVYNFITVIGILLIRNNEHPPRLGPVFWDISKEICLNRNLLTKDPRTIVLGILLLGRAGKLHAIHTHRERIFHELMKKLAHEYELNLSEVLQAYITLKHNV